MLRILISLLMIAPALDACNRGSGGIAEDNWLLTVYPDKFNLRVSDTVGRYLSLEECRTAAVEYISKLRKPGDATYECGLNCHMDESLDIYICKTTIQADGSEQ